MNLENLIKHYNSDKNNYGYPKIYESIFRNFKEKSINFLEIGIGTMIPGAHSTMVHVYGEGSNYMPGASLRAFRDYFPNGNIYGGDVQLDCMFSEERITTLLFNSLIQEECNSVLKDLQFDVIIDDGDHTNSSQEATFRNLWPRVKPGGYYFIEDVSEYGLESFFYRWPEKLNDILKDDICWDKQSTPWGGGPKLLVFAKR
jgi:hypothetical protein